MTVETEVACYIFLATETKENVEDGLKAWKSVIPYTEEDVGGRFYIYIDKDFEYKRILEKTFACIVLLCSIHIFRYWKDKILTSARSYEDDKQVTLDGEVKASIYGQIKDLSSSPTEDIFCQRLQNLYQTSANVYIKASQYATEFEPFEDVFERNWNNCRGMWVKCYT